MVHFTFGHFDPCRADISEVALLHDQMQSGVQFETWTLCRTHIYLASMISKSVREDLHDGWNWFDDLGRHAKVLL